MTASVLGISCSQKESVLRPEQEGLQTKLVGNIHGEKEEGMLLVKVTAEAQKDISEGIMEPYILAGGLEEASVEPVFPVSTRCDQTALRHGLDRWYTVKFDESISLDAAAQKLATNDAILAIEYNTFIERTEPDASLEHTGTLTKTVSASSLPFNDEKLGIQWNLINTGDKSICETALEGADVGVKDAWNSQQVTLGSS